MTRPRLRRDVYLVATANGARILTNRGTESFTGATIHDSLRRLAARLDGTSTIDELTAALPDGYRVDEPRAGRYRVHGPVDPQLLAAVTSWFAERGVLADCLQVSHRSLEDVFLDLTGRELRS